MPRREPLPTLKSVLTKLERASYPRARLELLLRDYKAKSAVSRLSDIKKRHKTLVTKVASIVTKIDKLDPMMAYRDAPQKHLDWPAGGGPQMTEYERLLGAAHDYQSKCSLRQAKLWQRGRIKQCNLETLHRCPADESSA